MEPYYHRLFKKLNGWTIQGLFDGKRSISDIETLQTGSKGRVFFFDQEPMIQGVDNDLWDYVFQEPTIFANSEMNSEDKEYVQDRYPNFVDWYYFSHLLFSNHWFASQTMQTCNNWPMNVKNWNIKKEFLVDCNLVTGPRQYRLKVLLELSKLKLLDDCYFSFSPEKDYIDNLNENNYFNLDIDNILTLLPKSKISYDNFGKANHYRQNVTDTKLSNIIPLENLEKCFYMLVLETCMIENKKHLTEKIFKPIAAGKPFILVGGYKNLEYLKSYGFETFNDLWNEEYDKIVDPTERIKCIIELISYLKNLNRKKKYEIMFKAHEISLRNWQKFWRVYGKNIAFHEAHKNLEIAKKQYYDLCKSNVTQ